jgi:hypothetical protein
MVVVIRLVCYRTVTTIVFEKMSCIGHSLLLVCCLLFFIGEILLKFAFWYIVGLENYGSYFFQNDLLCLYRPDFFKMSGNCICEMTFWVGTPPFYLKDPEMEKGIRARRIGSRPKEIKTISHRTRVHDFYVVIRTHAQSHKLST